jgi:hypothetical protein
MKKQLATVAAGTLMAGVFILPASAQNDFRDITVTINQPQPNTTVGSKFTVTGTLSDSCPISDTVFLYDHVDSGSDNYARPYDPNDSHSYSVYSPVTINGNTFTYTVDLSKAYWNASGEQVPQVPQPGKANFYFSTEPYYNECYGSASVALNIQYPTPVQPTQAQKPKPVPSAIAKAEASPTPSPSPSIAPVMASASPGADTAGASLNPGVALALGALLGAAFLALAEVSALEYRKKHGPSGDLTKRNRK